MEENIITKKSIYLILLFHLPLSNILLLARKVYTYFKDFAAVFLKRPA